jgi:hypothetical protein
MGDEWIVGSTGPRKRRPGKEIHEDDPEPEDTAVTDGTSLANRRPVRSAAPAVVPVAPDTRSDPH